MKRQLLSAAALSALVIGVTLAPRTVAQVPDGPPIFEGQMPEGFGRRNVDPRIAAFAEISKGAKVQEGLYKTYQKGDDVYIEIPPHGFNKPLLCPIAIAKGGGMGGMTLNFEEQWVLLFKKQGEKVHLIRRNVRHKAKPGSPTAKAVEITYADSVLMSLRIAATNQQTQGTLINLNDIFMTDFGQFGLGHFDASRSVWHKVKVFPRNIELQIQATFVGGGRSSMISGHGDDGSVIDPRGKTVIVHYGLCELPDGGYQPRIADDRVGYFVTALKDYSSTSKDSTFVRYINRWRLEPAEPIQPGRLSVPKRSIKFYIEKTVPHEYRAAVQEGILEWNKAFEKIGFRNAIEVVQQRDDEDFDPEDMNYNTFRWITTDNAFAMGPSRANPLTGEILDADIIFDGDFIRYWKHERQIFRHNGREIEPASPIQAMDIGWGLDHALLQRSTGPLGWNHAPQPDSPQAARLNAIRQGVCQCRTHMKHELGMAAMAMVEAQLAQKDGDAKDKDAKDGKDAKKPEEKKDALLEELIQQAIKEVVMHEVGHTLGLRHNFKASTMLPNDQLHDTKITREKGLVGSVMDYSPVNLAPKGVKQGDFFTTTIGPYDYWAIEYGYKPEANDGELKKIASRGAGTPGLDYGTDEDTVLTSDPLINRFDMGQDVLKFSTDRVNSVSELIKTLAARVVDDNEGQQRNRVAFNILLGQYGNSAYLVSKYVGGEHAYRDHKGDPKGRDPLVPVSAEKQREAMKILQEKVFDDKAFDFPPELLRKLAVERWMHWGADAESTDYPLFDRILGIQRVAMNQLLSAKTLARVQVNALKVEKDAKPVTVSEVFRCVTDGVWSNLSKNGDKNVSASTIRRNLQREHLKKLSSMVLGDRSRGSLDMAGMIEMLMSGGGGTLPPDARALARHHLREINLRIDAVLKADGDADETQVAHLEECKERINKVLAASLTVND